jgi:hypothetical protein
VKKSFKAPDLKVPAALRDLYEDLRDRRLLPLVALLLVAIVAAPFLLSDSTEPKPPPVRSGGGTAMSSASETRLTVVPAAPGLRDPGRRLGHREPEDPFVPKYVAKALSDQSVEVESGGGGGTESDGGSEGGGETTPVEPPSAGLYYFTTAVKLKLVRSQPEPEGGVVRDEVVYPRVLPSTTLTGEKQQVVTYMGLGPKSKQPVFLVGDDVTGVFGEGKCLSGTEHCHLIELKVNEPEVFNYGENGVRIRIKVLGTELVKLGHP